jgi:hypothetical protein
MYAYDGIQSMRYSRRFQQQHMFFHLTFSLVVCTFQQAY